MSENSEKWCDLCLHRRKCQSIDSGIRVGTKPCFANICQWCRGVETRRNGKVRKPLREGEKQGLSDK